MSLTGAGLRTMRSVPNFGTVGALAEIIDNSIQWRVPNKTCNINVVLIEKGSGKTVKDVIITDNGIGMGSIIDRCLWFGGGTNHGAKTNLGKYGVGCPMLAALRVRRIMFIPGKKEGNTNTFTESIRSGRTMTSLMTNPTHKSKASQKLYYKLVLNQKNRPQELSSIGRTVMRLTQKKLKQQSDIPKKGWGDYIATLFLTKYT